MIESHYISKIDKVELYEKSIKIPEDVGRDISEFIYCVFSKYSGKCPPWNILSVGIGNGRVEEHLVKNYPGKFKIKGVDINKDMIGKLYEKLKDTKDLIEVQLDSFLNIDINEKFDGIFLFNVLSQLNKNIQSGWKISLEKCFSILNQSGLILINEEYGDLSLFNCFFANLSIDLNILNEKKFEIIRTFLKYCQKLLNENKIPLNFLCQSSSLEVPIDWLKYDLGLDELDKREFKWDNKLSLDEIFKLFTMWNKDMPTWVIWEKEKIENDAEEFFEKAKNSIANNPKSNNQEANNEEIEYSVGIRFFAFKNGGEKNER